MRFETGNKVAVLDDIIEGIVVQQTNNFITIKDNQGMKYDFIPSQLVKIDSNQSELTKYLDPNNPMFKQKITQKSNKKQFIKHKNKMILEIDLHINQLAKTTKGMSNYQMLCLQINTAQQKIEYAIQKRISKVVLIHGVGQGVLKSELHFLLQKYPVQYYDASYKKYGQGATEVSIYQQ